MCAMISGLFIGSYDGRQPNPYKENLVSLKLLKNLKSGKAVGPDKLKHLLLKELRDEIAPIIKVIFEKYLQTGKLPS